MSLRDKESKMIETTVKAVGKVTTFLNGGTPSTEHESYFNGDIPWITGTDISDFRVSRARSFITEDAIRRSATSLVPKGTPLLVTRTSVGKVAIAPIELCFSQDITAIIPDGKFLDTKYLIYFLSTKETHFKRHQRGATIKGITREVVADIEIPLPSVDEQKRIAAILDKADRLRRQRRFAQTLSDSFLQSVFFKMFGDPVANPMDWEQIVFGKWIKLKSGDFLNAVSMDRKGSFPVYGGNGINGYHSSFLFEEEKIVIGRVGAYCGAVHYTEPFSWITDNALYVLRKTSDLSDMFLVCLLRYLNLNQFAGQSGQPLISEGRLEGINLIAPPLPLQEKFAAIVQKFERIRRHGREATRQAEHLFQTLLQRAFRGEL
jgi:type I restriction enzyme, S subunit